MATIGDVFFKALLDDQQLQVDAVKAGNKAGQTLGQRMSSGLKSGLRTVAFGALTGGLALATKGVMELENVTADFTAQTGLAGEEAKKAGQAINKMAGSNMQPMAEIGDTLAKVHTDLSLTGDAAVRTTKAFLKFGRATKQGPAAAVKAFDDILDAWNLQAEDAQGIMDKLIVSHQKYGGSIEENEAALANLAPALKAANLTIDDGIGLLNLLQTAGVDSAVAVTGMTKALKKVKSPEELQALIEDIRNTEDPFLRAQKAADLFGAKAGAKLANALKPGAKALEDYQVTAEDAAGATEDAARAMDSTFGSRVQLLIKGFTSKLIELGSQFGPVLLGLSSLTSLAGTLRLDRALAGVFGKLGVSAILKGAVHKAGALIGAIYGAAMGTATKIADVVAQKWNEIGKSILVKLAATRAGTVVGAIYGAAAGAVSNLAAALATGWAMVSVGPAALAGTAAGTAYAAAVQAALVAAPLILVKPAQDFFSSLTGFDPVDPFKNVKHAVGVATIELTDEIKAQMAAGELAVRPSAEAVGDAIEDPITTGAEGASAAVETATAKIVSTLGALRSEIGQKAAAAAGEIWDPILKAAELAQTKADIAEQTRVVKDKKSTKEQVKEATLRRVELQKQLFLQISDLTTYGTDAEKIASINAALATKAVADAYRDGTPDQKADIEEWRQALIAERDRLTGAASTTGNATVDAYAEALADGEDEVTDAAETATSGVEDELDLSRQSRTWGADIGTAWVAGIVAQIARSRVLINEAAHNATLGLHGKSPPPVGPLRDIDVWGAHVGAAWSDAFVAALRAGMGKVHAALAEFPTVAAPSLGSAVSIPSARPMTTAATGGLAAAPAAGGNVYNITVPVSGLLKAETPEDVARPMRRLASLGYLGPVNG